MRFVIFLYSFHNLYFKNTIKVSNSLEPVRYLYKLEITEHYNGFLSAMPCGNVHAQTKRMGINLTPVMDCVINQKT